MFAKKHHILAIVLVPLIWAGSKPANSEEAQVPPSIPFSIYTDEFDDDSGIDQSGKTNIISEDGYIKFAPPGAMGEIDPQTSLGQGLIGLWHLNGNTRDASGNGHDGELGGAASCDAAGIYNEGCRFTGAGDYIDIADSADIAEGEAIGRLLSRENRRHGKKMVFYFLFMPRIAVGSNALDRRSVSGACQVG